jgi:hypothetical protein
MKKAPIKSKDIFSKRNKQTKEYGSTENRIDGKNEKQNVITAKAGRKILR